MFHTSIIATAFLATIAIAMPSRVLDDRSHPRDDTATMCAAGDTSTTDGVQALLDNTGAIDWLDIMLSTFPDGEGGWVDKLWTTVFIDQGASPLSGCGNIGSDCTIDTLCQDYSTPMAYWTLKSVQMLHSKINTIHSMLLWDGWLAGLSIDQIAEDFSSVDPSSEWAKWISAAFTMAGGFATGIDLSKPLRGMVGFASGALSEVGNTSGNSDNVDTTSVENTLKNIVGSAGNYLASILQNATGNGDSTTLPIYTLSTLQYGTSRFLSDNTILLDENSDNSTFMSAYDSYGKNVVSRGPAAPFVDSNADYALQQQMLVDVALKTAWYVLLEDEDVAQSDCTFTGSLWLQGASEEHCFYITRPTTTKDCTNNDPSSVSLALLGRRVHTDQPMSSVLG